MDEISDLCGTASGDGAAFGRLVKAQQARVFAFLGRMGLDAAACEDVAQDTFLRVWRNAGSFDPRRSAPTTWILTIARNLALTHLAKAGKRREVADDEAAAQAPCPAPPPDAAIEQSQMRDWLDAALARLAPADRSLLAASYVDGLGMQAIARIEGCSQGAAKVRLHRARERLRKILEQDHV